jgi:uncharacterized protein
MDELLADVPGVMVVGPRGCGKTTSAEHHAVTTLRMDRLGVRQALLADPDAVLAVADPPVLVDEWQLAPDALAAAKRLIDADPAPGRFIFTGSAADDVGADQWPGTGRFIRVSMWGLAEREIERSVDGLMFADRIFEADPTTDLPLALPRERPDLAGYVDRLLASGFPEARARSSERTRIAWLDSYVDHLVGRDVALIADVRDPRKLRRYLRALASSTAGSPSAETLMQASELNRSTVDRYDALLERLFVTERVPAWSSNRLTRVTGRAKRYVCDPAIAASLLGADRRTILRDGDLLGRLVDTFVAAQLRPELALGRMPIEMLHLRSRDDREIDIILERRDGRVVAIEVKAANAVDLHDARHLIWARDRLAANEFVAGVVMYTGEHVVRLADRIWAVPICALWA